MLAEQSLREGRLDDCLAQLQEAVRNDPSKPELRTFLFQLLSVLGQWDRALAQLKVAGDLDPGALAMVQTYRELIPTEVLRNEIFAGRKTPLVLGEPSEWLALLIEALRADGGGQHARAAELRAQAFEQAPTSSGTADGQPFTWIADSDSRLGPVLELVVAGAYRWVPFASISSIHLEEPADLRDMVWTPAKLCWSNGGEAVGMIPTRYAASEQSPDPLIRLARKTEWLELGEDNWRGEGQRILATDAGEYPLMELRELLLDTADSTDESNG